MNPSQNRVSKQSYEPPRLVVYGDLQRLTGAKGRNNNDGTGVPQTKT